MALLLSPATADTVGPAEWDVDAEIARELEELQHGSACDTWQASPDLSQEPSAVQALWQALAAREQLADKLAGTLQEIQQLPETDTPCSKALHTAGAEEVAAAVAALQRHVHAASTQSAEGVHACSTQQLDADDVPQQQTDGPAARTAVLATSVSVAVLKGSGDEGATWDQQQQTDAATADASGASSPRRTCVHTHCSETAPSSSLSAVTEASSPQQPSSTAAAKEPVCTPDGTPGHALGDSAAHLPTSAPLPAPNSPWPAAAQLSPPHTPNTQDKRQIVAAAPLARAAEQPQQQCCLTACAPSSTKSTTAASNKLPDCRCSSPTAAMAAAAAAAAEAAVAAEQAAAAAAQQQQAQEQSRLQQLMQQQVAAAAARQAAQQALQLQLQAQAQAAAVSYMSAWRIAKAWQRYKRNFAHAKKVEAAVCLQAAVRGIAARRLLRQLQDRQGLLSKLQEAERSGQHHVLQQAAAAAANAGLQQEAEQALQRYGTASAAAASDMQRAAESGTFAAFTAAAAAAAKFSTLSESCSSCKSLFLSRQQAAAEALTAAVASMPLPQVQHAVDAALELGLSSKELAAALEAARERDTAAVTRLSAAVRALVAETRSMLAGDVSDNPTSAAGTGNSHSGGVAASAVSTPGQTLHSYWDVQDCSLQSLMHSLQDATAACRQFAKAEEVQQAEATVQHCRQQAAAKLAQAAQQHSHAQAVQHVLCWCGQLGGLEKECAAATALLQHRQQQLEQQLQAALTDPKHTIPAVQQLLQQAQALGVPAGSIAAAQQVLQQKQDTVLQLCWQAARSGSLQQLRAAISEAEQQGVDKAVLQQCQQLMSERQQAGAHKLAEVAASMCAAAAACGSAKDLALCQQQMQQLLAENLPVHGPEGSSTQQVLAAAAGISGSGSGSNHGACSGVAAVSQGHQVAGPSVLRQRLQQLRQQAAACASLGLNSNVAAAAQAVMLAVHVPLMQGQSAVATFTQQLDDVCGPSAAVSGSRSSGGSNGSSSSSNGTQSTDQSSSLWEEGMVTQHSWVQEAAIPCTASLQDWATQHRRASPGALGPSNSWLTLELLRDGAAACCAATNSAAVLSHLLAPTLQLQQQWAENLAGASAYRVAQQQPQLQQPAPTHTRPVAAKQTQVPQQQQQQQQAGVNWLRRLLAANTAGPLEQLTKLDLSLEQLPGLFGLGALCPQLLSLAANMNGLKTLQGLQGCAQLLQLSAQDNKLQEPPDISCHPQLSSLMLDGNQLSSILPCSNSSPGAQPQPHRALHTLSLNNNHISSISSCSSDGSPSCNSSSGSSNSSSPWLRAPLLSAWLPGLQVLRLSGNWLHNLDGLQGCSNLRLLDVSRNKLTSLQGLHGCCLLQRLDASDNRLSRFPSGLHLPLLQQLNLCSNAFAVWPDLPPLPHLQRLSLADNQLQHLAPMHGLLQLESLDVSFNALTDFQACLAALQTAGKLQQLQLHDNALRLQQHEEQQELRPGDWALAGAGAGAGEQVALAAHDASYRQHVAAALPWLLKLDGEEVLVSERLAGCLHFTHQQQQQQQQHQQQHQQEQQVLGAGSSISMREASAFAAGRLVAGSSLRSQALQQQLRAGLIVGLGGVLLAPSSTSTTTASNSCCSSRSSRSGLVGSRAAALHSAAALLPCLRGGVECSPTAASNAANSSQGPAERSRLPCVHLQQLLQRGCNLNNRGWLGSAVGGSSCGQGASRHCSGAFCTDATGACELPAWLHRVEIEWCYSTRSLLVQQQSAQQAACQRQCSSCRLWCEPPADVADSSSSSNSSLALKDAAPAADAAATAHALAVKHLQHLQQQPCSRHQQQLVLAPCFAKALQQRLAAAAVVLQTCWRARAARLLFQQELRSNAQQELLLAAVILQALWRGRQCRCAFEALKAQQRQQAASAAAVKIQAAIRGHKVRSRLKAALAAAQVAAADALRAPAAVPGSHRAPASAQCGAAQLGHVATDAAGSATGAVQEGSVAVGRSFTDQQQQGLFEEDDWELSGIPDGLFDLPQDLLDAADQLFFADAAGTERLAAIPEPLLKQPTSGKAAAGVADCATSPPPAAAGAAAPVQEAAGPVSHRASLQDGLESGPGGGAVGHAAVEAKITALMSEWGFTDRATAEAYYRRQKHTLKAATKHKLEQQLRDPAVRLRRLQAQLSSSFPAGHTGHAAVAAATTAAAATVGPASNSAGAAKWSHDSARVSSCDSGGIGGGQAKDGGSVGAPGSKPQQRRQQQPSIAAGRKLQASYSHGASSSSGGGRKPLLHSSSARVASTDPGACSSSSSPVLGQRPAGLQQVTASCSGAQKQPLALPALVLPLVAPGAAASVTPRRTSKCTSLPRCD